MWSTLCRNYVIDDLSQIFYLFFFGWTASGPTCTGRHLVRLPARRRHGGARPRALSTLTPAECGAISSRPATPSSSTSRSDRS